MELDKLEAATYLQEKMKVHEIKIQSLTHERAKLRNNYQGLIEVDIGGGDHHLFSKEVGIQAFNLALAEEKELLYDLQQSLKAL